MGSNLKGQIAIRSVRCSFLRIQTLLCWGCNHTNNKFWEGRSAFRISFLCSLELQPLLVSLLVFSISLSSFAWLLTEFSLQSNRKKISYKLLLVFPNAPGSRVPLSFVLTVGALAQKSPHHNPQKLQSPLRPVSQSSSTNAFY